MATTDNRQYYWNTPVTHNGIEYPANMETLLDSNGNIVDRNVFADAQGNRYFVNDDNTLTEVIPYGGTLDEVKVTAPLTEKVIKDRLGKEYLQHRRNDVINSPDPFAWIKFENELTNGIKQRQAIMRAAGYDVPDDGHWSYEQQDIWDKLNTHKKEYDTTLWGFRDGLYDNLTGNTTYKTDLAAPDKVDTHNDANVNWQLTNKSQNKFIKAMDGTWIPVAVASSAGPSMVSAPLATIAGAVAGWAGNKLVDTASEAATGLDFGSNIAKFTPLTPDMAGWLNPGGWYSAPRGAAMGDALQTSLTGKSREFMKPLVKKYLGEPYYNNIRPSGYGNNDKFAKPRKEQIFDMFKDFMTPLFLRKDVSNPDFRPGWFADKNNPTIFEMFRNDAHRLSMGLEPHKEILADGKPHSLYVKKENGNYDVDWDYIRHVKDTYPDTENLKTKLSNDFPSLVGYKFGTSPANGSVIANDRITLNGGYGTYTFNPDKLYNSMITGSRNAPTHFSSGDVKFTDTWDVQPFIDSRSFWPWLSRVSDKVVNKNIPVSKAAENIKNTELVNTFGGHPFTQETVLPDQDIGWYPKD